MAIRYLSGINVDSNTLFVDSANDRVGIGTNSPNSKLEVVGAAIVRDSPTTNDWGLRLQNTNTGGWGVSQFFNLYGYASSPASDFAALQIRVDYPGYGRTSFVVKEQAQSSTAESLVLRGNGQVYMNAGNVGIGTTAPSYRLDVVATSNATYPFIVRNAGNAEIGGIYSTSGGAGQIYLFNASSAATAKISTIDASYFNGGNLLVGTTTDAGQTFQVVGSSSLRRASGTTQTNIVEFKNTTNDAYLTVTGIGTTSDVATWTNGSMVVEAVPFSTGSMILSAYTGSLIIQTGRTNRLEIGSSGTVRLNNYGSGSKTGTPAYNLAVDSSGNVIELPGGVVDGSGTANYVSKWSDANTLTDSVIYDNGTNVGIGTLPTQGVRLQVAGAVDVWSSLNTLLRLNHDGTRGVIESYTGGGFSPTALNPSGGNVLVGTTSDAGYKLRVNGTIYADSTITSATSVRAVEGYFNPYTSAGNIATPVYQDAIFLGPLDNDCTIQFGNEFQSTHGSYIRFRTNSASAQNTPVNVMTMFPNGKVALNQYGAGTFTAGTPTYNLAVDASGNIIETAGGVVDGSGTANYVTKWQDANTVTNSSITDDGTTVTATAANFVSQSNLGTAYESFTTSGTTAIFDTITRTNSAIYQIVIVANPNSAGSGAYADFYYGKVFIGTGYNGSAVVDVINYHQESPMPRGLYGSGGGDLTVTAVMLVGGSEVTEVAVNTSYTIRIKIAGYNVAGSNTTVRLQRIM